MPETTAVRPGPPFPAPEGREWVPFEVPEGEAGLAEREPGKPERKCRYRTVERRACGRPAVLWLMKGIRRRVQWYFCLDPKHSYGHWIENGKVYRWKLQEAHDGPGSA